MRTFLSVKGLPVYNQDRAEKMGEVVDLSISKNGQVEGLLVKTGGFLKHHSFLAIDQVVSFGRDGIMIADADCLVVLKDSSDYTLSHQRSLEGKLLVSKSGDSLGLLKDVCFLEEVGTIVGYEVTDGFFTDITEGKQVIESEAPPAIGKDAIIVDVNDT